jgi:hypothetical protein
MKKITLLIAAVLLPTLAFATDYNLGNLAKSKEIELFNRTLDQTKAGAPEVVYLNSADGYGVTWITGLDFSNGTIELEIKGQNTLGGSFVGIAFHGQNNKTFDAVYLRPFNFQAAEDEHRSHSIQYISLPDHDWSELRKTHPGKYEAALNPAPQPASWVKLKVVVEGNRVSAFVNKADKPALSIEPLNDRHAGKLGLWVGNGSNGWFRNLKISTAGSKHRSSKAR